MDPYQIHIEATDATIPPGSTIADYGNFTVELPFPIKCKEITPIQVTIPNSWYNVTSANYTIAWVDTTANNRSTTITARFYTASQLATAIQTAMNAIGATGTYTCSYDANTGKFTIAEVAGPTNFQLSFATAGCINNLIGFNSVNKSGAATYTSDNVANVTGPSAIYISSANLSRGFVQSIFRKNQSSVVMKIPVDVQAQSTIVYANQLADYAIKFPSQTTINKLDFKLLFPDGTQVDMNGVPWNITFVVK